MTLRITAAQLEALRRAVALVKMEKDPLAEQHKAMIERMLKLDAENRELKKALKKLPPLEFVPVVHMAILEKLALLDERLKRPTATEFYRLYLRDKLSLLMIARRFRVTKRTLINRKRLVELTIQEAFGGQRINLKLFRETIDTGVFDAADRELRREKKARVREKSLYEAEGDRF